MFPGSLFASRSVHIPAIAARGQHRIHLCLAQNGLQRLVRVFSDVFMPILPALIIAGLLMGINNLIGAKGMFIADKTLLDAYPSLDGLWSLINLLANTSFVFLPALVGWSAAKRFGGSEILGIVLGLMLVHPDLLNAWNYGESVAGLDGQSLPNFDIFGWFKIEKVGYQGQILPILMAGKSSLWTRLYAVHFPICKISATCATLIMIG